MLSYATLSCTRSRCTPWIVHARLYVWWIELRRRYDRSIVPLICAARWSKLSESKTGQPRIPMARAFEGMRVSVTHMKVHGVSSHLEGLAHVPQLDILNAPHKPGFAGRGKGDSRVDR